MKGLISILGCKSCFIPVTVLTHRGKFNKGIPNLWMKSYSDTIEIKPLWLNICIVLFFSYDCSKRNVDFYVWISSLDTVLSERLNVFLLSDS